jgi:hypothetical protein
MFVVSGFGFNDPHESRLYIDRRYKTLAKYPRVYLWHLEPDSALLRSDLSLKAATCLAVFFRGTRRFSLIHVDKLMLSVSNELDYLFECVLVTFYC